MSDVQTTDNPEQHRYEARVDGELAGFAEYRVPGDRVVFTHTEVDDASRARASAPRSRGSPSTTSAPRRRGCVPQCPFIRRWIDKHPEYADLVDEPVADRRRAARARSLHRSSSRQAEMCTGAHRHLACAIDAGPSAHLINRFALSGWGFPGSSCRWSEAGPSVARELGHKSPSRQIGEERQMSGGGTFPRIVPRTACRQQCRRRDAAAGRARPVPFPRPERTP